MRLTSSAVAAILFFSISTSALPMVHDVESRSFLSSILGTAAKDGAEDVAKDAGKAASSGILGHLKNAAITGIEGLVGTEVVSSIADKIDPNLASAGGSEASDEQTNSTVAGRSLLSGLFGTAAKDGAEDVAADAEKVAAKSGILSHLKNAAITGIEGLVGTEVVSSIADKIDPSLAGSGESTASDEQTNSTSQNNSTDTTVAARSLLSSLFGTAAKDGAKDVATDAEKVAAKSGILSHLKNAAITGVEGLVGTEVVSSIADKIDPGLAEADGSAPEAAEAQINGTTTDSTSRRMLRLRREPGW